MTGYPPRRAFAAARFRYERDRLRARWRLVTGRCPGCPKKRSEPHKFGCHKPGPLPSMRTIRRNP